MSNVIGFLEKMGRDAELRHATKNEMEMELTRAEIDPELKTAILNRDQAQLEALLGARTNVVCAIMPGKEEDDEEDEESPVQDDDESVGAHAPVLRMASSG